MKFNKLIFAVFLGMLFFTVSCKKSTLADVNQDPNVLNTVNPNLLLSTVESGLGYTQGGDFSRTASMVVQQTLGANSQMQTFYIYGYNPGSFDQMWADLYTTTMENDFTLMKVADAGGYNRYSGVARILMAYSLQLAVDNWGSIPYSKAFQGNTGGTIQPGYDSASALYDTIASLVNVGISQLTASSAGAITPGSEDVIYSGNAASWVKFGHAIKARLYIHQSKNNVAMANKALAEISSAIATQSDNAQYVFPAVETAANPWYQFNSNRAGNIEFHTSPFAKMLLTLNDPRYGILIDSLNEDNGALTNGHYGGLNSYYGSISSPVEFITYEELLFIQAEATINAGGTPASAQGFYTAAITANMAKLGVPGPAIATYLTTYGTLLPSTNAALAQIATQEFIALYLNPEAWTLWRRTGIPVLTPTSGSEIPRRLEYPQSELSYNANNVPASTLFTPTLFWDK